MAYSEITFQLSNGGLGRREPSEDGVSALIITDTEGPGSSNIYRIFSAQEAEELGIDRQFENTSNALSYYHISEFFRLNPNGELFVMFLPEGATPGGDPKPYLEQLVSFAEGRIRQVGICGSDLSHMASVAALCEPLMLTDKQGLVVLYEYRNFVTPTGALSLPSITLLENQRCVAYVVGQDLGAMEEYVADVPNALACACVGTALGTLSAARVHQNIGAVKFFQLSSAGRFTKIGLSGGRAVNSLNTNQLKAIDALRVVFVRRHPPKAGAFFNNDYTLAPITSDFSSLRAVRTIQKAIRGVHEDLTEELNNNADVDPSTGQLAIETVKYLTGVGKNGRLEQMQKDNEITERGVYINPVQDLLQTDGLKVSIRAVPRGIVGKFEVTIGYTTQLTN